MRSRHSAEGADTVPKLYTWEQTPAEVRIFVPLTEDFNFKRDVSYAIKNGRQMTLKVSGREIIDGTLAGSVDQDAAEWACNVHEEKGVRGLEMHLEKVRAVPWRACFEGEEPDEPAAAAAVAVASPAPPPAKAATPAAPAAAAAAPAPAKKPAGVAFTEAATKLPPPSTRPPAAAVAAAAAEAEGGSSTCMMCMVAGAVLGVVGYAVDHWQKNSL